MSKLTERLQGIGKNVGHVLKKPVAYGTLLALYGCGEIKEPHREDYSNKWIAACDYQLRDENGDGRVDFISLNDNAGIPIYVDTLQSKSHFNEVGFSARQMSPEIVESTTRLKDAINDLDYLMEKERYNRSKRK